MFKDKQLPRKLRNDAIVEVAFEIQFSTNTLPERLIGRFADSDPWKTLAQRRLPASDFPAALRETTPGLRYLPTVEISQNDEEARTLRLGPNVVSLHRARKYAGWERFRAEAESIVAELFRGAESISVSRLGLRYLNALRPDLHGISSISDLFMSVSVAGEPLTQYVSLTFQTTKDSDKVCRVNVQTPEAVKGFLPENTKVYIDVDVFTPPDFECLAESAVKDWLESAHTLEKQQFFCLLHDKTISDLKEL